MKGKGECIGNIWNLDHSIPFHFCMHFWLAIFRECCLSFHEIRAFGC